MEAGEAMNLKEFAKLSIDQTAQKIDNYKATPTATKPKKTNIKGFKDLSRRYNTTTPYGV